MPMAIVTLTLQDSDSDTGTVAVYVDVGIGDTVESLSDDYAEILWNVVRPLVNGVLIKAEVSIRPDISGWTNNTLATISDVEEKAIFALYVCGGYRTVKLTLPTVKESIFTNSGAGKFVDETNSDYIAFAVVLENGVVDDGIGATDSHGVDICGVIGGEQFFGKG